MAERPPLLWLGGAAALELAPRLEASGYRTSPLPSDEGLEPQPPPAADALILTPPFADRIAELRGRWGSLPILLGCPRDDVEGRRLALSSGADDLWLIAAGPSDLLTRLRLHLRLRQAAREQAPSMIVVDDLRVDPRSQSVERGGRSLELTSREHQLLMFLLEHRCEVVSRDRILREIWPQERTSRSNVIEVYVRYLRRKLEAGGASRLIHTVRGQGYCLRATPPTPETLP